VFGTPDECFEQVMAARAAGVRRQMFSVGANLSVGFGPVEAVRLFGSGSGVSGSGELYIGNFTFRQSSGEFGIICFGPMFHKRKSSLVVWAEFLLGTYRKV